MLENEEVDKLIKQLNLFPHEEGGYFRQTYKSQDTVQTERENNGGVRRFATSIYYMLTENSPIGFFHKNLSPILHFYHSGGPLTYRFIHPDGSIEEHILGPDLESGHKLQLVAPGGVWKSSELKQGYNYGLVSEVVLPGWEQFDRVLAPYHDLLSLYPEHDEWLRRFSYGA
ncbi:cupin [Vibrio azureus]|uniref:DUF985 domain-containing protein n=1 Tax=Vibrio azureus NBRC 104587 TaxID=1219077 RepID=U3C1Q6_9VIBR|nr:cupin domain-containing protein [Vibrio azureus]AUI85496.1 cupin [Vibrio azureus]GAD75409.1 hypothetical protein VAZ01S_025_00040 [Vibrio azureus NBRC 104587]